MAGRVARRGLGALCSRLESLSLAPARGTPHSQARSQSQSQSQPQSQSKSPLQAEPHAQAQSHPQTQAEPMLQSRDPGSNQWHAKGGSSPLMHSAFEPPALAPPSFSSAGNSRHSHIRSSSQLSSTTHQLPHLVTIGPLRHCTGSAALFQLIAAAGTEYRANALGMGHRRFSTTAGSFRAAGPLLSLNELRPAKGSTHNVKRLGRGIGSGKGKTAGRGHKGQKSRSGNKPRIGFEGGQTPLRLRLPKRGFHNPFSLDFQVVNLRDVIEKVDAGAIDPASLITMKTLKDVGLGGKATRDGVKLLGGGSEAVSMPLHFEVSRVSESAREAVEKAGGSVTRVHYNKLGLRALLRPEWFAKKGRLLPRPARPPPRIVQLGLVDAIGRLPAPTTPMPAEAS